jgi:hypothetical protein
VQRPGAFGLARQRGRRLAGTVVVVDDVDHHHGDVVATPALVGEAHELVGRLVGLAQPAQHRLDLAVVDLVDQPVAAEEEAVALVGVDRLDVDLDVGLDAEHAGHDVALRVDPGLVLGHAALADHVLDEAVVLAELDQLAVAQQVHARVADVDPRDLLAAVLAGDDRHRAQGGAHPAVLGVLRGAVVDGAVGQADALDERLDRGLVGVDRAERLHRDLRGDLAGRVAAHAVGDRVEADALVGGVLVVLADASGVGLGCGADLHPSSITVLPTRRRSPAFIAIGPETFLLLR